jgi:sulfur carrier protein ThiS
MRVTAVLLGMHRAFLPPGSRQEGRVTLEFESDEVQLPAVLAALGIPTDAPRIVFLDGDPITDDQPLHDGQTVTLVSPVGGG